jgi:dihydrofolate reductase
MLSIVVALSENNVIGSKNNLPWKLSGDLKRVKVLTMGHHLIMGRKTFESIGRPLPGRTTIIITRKKDYHIEGCLIASSLSEAIELSKSDNEAFIFGGGEIFREALPHVKRIYMTRVHAHINGDTFFPEINYSEWKEISREEFPADEKNQFPCSVITLERN